MSIFSFSLLNVLYSSLTRGQFPDFPFKFSRYSNLFLTLRSTLHLLSWVLRGWEDFPGVNKKIFIFLEHTVGPGLCTIILDRRMIALLKVYIGNDGCYRLIILSRDYHQHDLP